MLLNNLEPQIKKYGKLFLEEKIRNVQAFRPRDYSRQHKEEIRLLHKIFISLHNFIHC